MTPEFRFPFESAPGLYLVLTPDLKIAAVTDAYLQATMTQREEILGRDLFDVFPDNPEDPTATGVGNLCASLERVMQTKSSDVMAVQKYDIRRPQSEGGGFEERYWSPVNSPVLDREGQIVYIIHRVEDVTEFVRLKDHESKLTDELQTRAGQMQAEMYRSAQEVQEANKQLRQLSGFLDAIVEHIPNMVFLKDAERLAFERVNRAAEELLGLSRTELLGKTDFDFFPKHEAEFFQQKDRETLASGEIVDIPEETVQTRTGVRWLHTRKVAIRRPDGQPAYLLGVSSDITDRKAAEAALTLAKENLETANRDLESFSYSISHDLRAPLRAVDGYARILEEEYADKIGDEGRRLLGVVRSEALRMGVLIDDLLAFSRLGRQSLTPARVEIGKLCEEVMREVRATRPDRTIEFQPDDVPPALADRATLRQVVVNLLSNAVKYAKPQGTIRISFGGERSGDHNTYWLRDNGIGFDMRYAEKIFGVFQRLHDDRQFEGTGVGLAIVERIIVRNGGRVWAEGEPGKGATFFFTLPSPTD